MPIEIRELIIRANISENGYRSSNSETSLNSKDVERLKKQVLSACMEKVEALLERKMRR
jgi:Family of unknown function (DUF5908)